MYIFMRLVYFNRVFLSAHKVKDDKRYEMHLVHQVYRKIV